MQEYRFCLGDYANVGKTVTAVVAVTQKYA